MSFLDIFRQSAGTAPSAERLADLEGQLAAIHKAQAVIEFELDGTIITANDNFLGAVGYSLGEVQGQHHRLFVTPETAASSEYKAFWAKLGRGEYDAGQYCRIAKGGKEIWIQASYNPIMGPDGKAFKVVKYATDITAQVEANAALNTAVEQAKEVLGAAESGDLSQRIDLATKDGLMRELCDSVNVMLDGIAESRDREQSAAAENLRIRSALDNVTTNVMIADNDRNIVYMNESVGEMLAEAEADIQKELPKFRVQGLMGGNIDAFHKNPDHQARMIAALKETYRTEIQLGGRTFGLIASPVLDADGKRLGTVVEWKDRTAEIQLENELKERAESEKAIAAENLRIRNALDNVTTNVMIADNDRVIQYCNNSLGEMLAKAEGDIRKDLPTFNAAKVLGESIDQFHKNPAHQKGMLAALRSTHKALIKVGGRTFSLVVNPILDAQGERAGTVVEWQDRTAEVAVEAEVGGIVEAAGRGEFSERIRLDDKEGFFQRLATGINELLEACEVGFTDVIRVLSSLAKGDLTQQIEADYQGLFGELKDNLNTTVSSLGQVVGSIKQATDEINNASRDIAAGSSDLSSRTEQQAASLEETASSMEELTSTVKQNAENAKQANQLSIGASDVATRGGESVGQVVERMTEITESSKKIEDIISVIEGIAFQTNILALNAAVEAARAGEQGRGFAVVASEVRSLAQRSSGAAKEIKTLIGNSVARIEDGSRLVNEAGTTMEEIVSAVKRVTDIMAEISAASQEQSSGIEQVNQTITQMDEVTQQNAALVEESSASARSLEDQAATLSQAVSRFRLAGGGEAIELPAPVARRIEDKPKTPARVAAGPKAAPPRPAATNGGEHWAEF